MSGQKQSATVSCSPAQTDAEKTIILKSIATLLCRAGFVIPSATFRFRGVGGDCESLMFMIWRFVQNKFCTPDYYAGRDLQSRPQHFDSGVSEGIANPLCLHL